MFKIVIPAGTKLTLDVFKKAKNELYIQHLQKVASAPSRDVYAFGQKVSDSSWNVTKQFKSVLRQLNDTCKAATGESCVSTEELETE